LKPKEIWSIRIRLQLASKTRDLTLFNLALDSKLRGCDLVNLRVRDVCQGGTVASRAIVMQPKRQQRPDFGRSGPIQNLTFHLSLLRLRIDTNVMDRVCCARSE